MDQTSKTKCPVIGCDGTATRMFDMRKHFVHRHPNDTIRIIEEGDEPYPKCPLCRMHVAPRTLANHGDTKECQKGQVAQERRTAAQKVQEATTTELTVGPHVLENVEQFCYLGRPILANDDDIGAIRHNIGKARRKWQMLSQLLIREGARPQIMGVFYKAVVQAVLLYGSETWVITKKKYQLLNAFHVTAARRISRLTFRLNEITGIWERPSAKLALERAGLLPLIAYLKARRSYIQPFVATLTDHQKLENRTRTGETAQKKFWTDDPTLQALEALLDPA
jgi:hypothetical protein